MTLLELFRHKGTIKGVAGDLFDPEATAKQLKKAFKGLGTDEKTVTDVIVSHNNAQRQEIKKCYKAMYGRDLISDFEDELGGHFLEALLALMCPSHLYDAHCIRKAIDGVGTDENTLIDILCSRTNSEMELIKEAYMQEFGKRLEDDIVSDTSSHLQRMLRSLVTAKRYENAKFDPSVAEKDAAKLQAAGVAKIGTDETVFNQIFTMRSWEQLQGTFSAYKKRTGQDIKADIRKEFSGDIRNALLAIVKVSESPIIYFAEKLHECIAGVGTDDETLIRIIISRSEVDLRLVKEEYQARYKTSLEKVIKEDCSGDYCRLLMKILN